jgi:16S rRNA (cytidine1402-2'-O)-methyltransferase
MALGKVVLIPMLLHEEGWEAILPNTIDVIQSCQCFFAENEKTARRYFKKIWKEMNIDAYQWQTIDKVEASQIQTLKKLLQEGKTIGIISEAGCAGVADPGQQLIAVAQEMGVQVKPYLAPNSILLALMASGLNGQDFHFHGYLPIETNDRKKKIQQLISEVSAHQTTQIFIETPYRNNQMLSSLLAICPGHIKICIGSNITGPNEQIITKTVKDWKSNLPELHKQLVIFLIGL